MAAATRKMSLIAVLQAQIGQPLDVGTRMAPKLPLRRHAGNARMHSAA